MIFSSVEAAAGRAAATVTAQARRSPGRTRAGRRDGLCPTALRLSQSRRLLRLPRSLRPAVAPWQVKVGSSGPGGSSQASPAAGSAGSVRHLGFGRGPAHITNNLTWFLLKFVASRAGPPASGGCARTAASSDRDLVTSRGFTAFMDAMARNLPCAGRIVC